jgi:exodeoxyribonuclease VII small subunit
LSPKSEAGASSKTSAPLSFEAAYGELQQVVAQLEGSNVDLARAIELLERGNVLVARCEDLVGKAELRVSRLSAESASPLVEP